MINSSALLSFAKFSNMSQWDVKQFFFAKVVSKYSVEKLGEHLVHQTEKILPSDYPDDDFAILGVSNKIGMFDASIEKGKSIKQKYHIVKNDWLAYNPYRINVGSIGMKTPDLKGGYISPAYVVFSCKETILPEYLWLMMKSDFFNLLIKDSTTGSVRQTLHFEKLAEIKAPIPSVLEQKKILQDYHELLDAADSKESEGDKYGATLLAQIQEDVSNLKVDDLKLEDTQSILHTVPFTATDRWEVEYIKNKNCLIKIYESFRFCSKKISEIQTESLFGLSLKASLTQEKGMIPMLRMPNIINGEIDCSDLKYLPRQSAITASNPRKYLLSKGDFLINRTNSKELVGKSAIFNLDGEYTYASYIIRYRFDTSVVIPEYVNIMFMLPIVRLQIDTVSRQTAGQCNINSDEIGAICIPVPTIPEQQCIIDKFNSLKDGANTYYSEAEELRRNAKSNFEKTIFSI